jgi:periplasmic protein TonB
MALTANSASGSRSTTVLAAVILLHIGIFYAIESGLTHKVIEMLPADIQAKVIKEDKPKEDEPPPPPPPDIPIQPPPFVPPPEVSVQTAAPTNAITNVTTERPPVVAPPVMAPPPADVVVNPRLDPKRSQHSLEEFYPASSKRAGEEGSTVVNVYVQGDGRISEVKVDTSSGFPDLDDGAVKYAKTWRLLPGTKNGTPQAMWYRVKVTFKITK